MQNSHKILSISFILVLTLLGSASVYQGRVIKNHKKDAMAPIISAEQWLVTDSLQPIEQQSLPAFQHLVIDCPGFAVFVHHTNLDSDWRMLHRFEGLTAEDLFEFHLVNDTMYVRATYRPEQRRMNNVSKYGNYDPLLQTDHLKLGIRSPNLESITIKDGSKLNLAYQLEEYPDDAFEEEIKNSEAVERSPYLADQLDLHFHGVCTGALKFHVKKVNVHFTEVGDWVTSIRPYGKSECLTLWNSYYTMVQHDHFSTDTLQIQGHADWITGAINMSVNHHLMVDVRARRKLEIGYDTNGKNITSAIHPNPYLLIREIE